MAPSNICRTAWIALLSLLCVVSQAQVRNLTVEVGTGNDDLREGSRVEVTFITRGRSNHTVEVARGARWADRTRATINVDLPYSAAIAEFERIDVKFVPNKRALMEDDKWWFTSLVVRSRTGETTLYTNNAVNHKFERKETWTTGVLPGYRRTTGNLITVRDESNRIVPNAEVFLGSNRLGTTNSAGQLNTTSAISATSPLVVKHRVHKQDYYRSNHSFDSTRNWNYRVYHTNLQIQDSGAAVPQFTLRDDQVNVTVRRRQIMFGLNFLTVLEWDMPSIEEAQWRTLASQFSQFLFNATDGQFFVERFRVVDQSRAWNDSDFRVRADWGYRANVPFPTGGFLGWNILDSMMNMSRSDSLRVYAHEFGHFGLDVSDEYRDNDPNIFCSGLVNGIGPFAMFQPQSSCMMFHQDLAPKLCSNHPLNMHQRGTRQGDQPCWDKIISRWSNPGRWELVNPASRASIPGTITLQGTAVNHAFIQPVTTFDNANRPGVRARITLRVSGPAGPENMANVVLRELGAGGRSLFMGSTNASGVMSLDGVHTGDSVAIMSADNLRFAVGVIPATGGTLAVNLTSLESNWFAQVRPGGNDPINLPSQPGSGYALPVSCRLDGGGVAVTVSAPTGVNSVDEISFQPVGGRAISRPVSRRGNDWIATFPLQGVQDGYVFAKGRGSNGKEAFGMAGIMLTQSPEKSDGEIFGPGGGIALHDLRQPKSRILMTSEGFGNNQDKFRSSVYRVDGAANAFAGSRIEIRIPGPYRSVIPSKGQVIQGPRLYKWDEGKQTWHLVGSQVWHSARNMVSAPCSGPGLYQVAG